MCGGGGRSGEWGPSAGPFYTAASALEFQNPPGGVCLFVLIHLLQVFGFQIFLTSAL